MTRAKGTRFAFRLEMTSRRIYRPPVLSRAKSEHLFEQALRWIPGGRWQGRLDVSDYLYRIRYPDAFYRGTDDVPALLAATVPRSRWTNTGAFTIGLSYLFGR